MTDPFVAEIRIVAFQFAPTRWAFCNGQLLPISQNTALFSLLGATYGGDGMSTFALPDLQGRVPMMPGQGPGLSSRTLGETAGSHLVMLTQGELPPHSHALQASSSALDNDPGPNAQLGAAEPALPVYTPPGAGPLVSLAPETLAPAGGGLPHNNLQPYLTANFVIALQGIFPAHP